VQLVTADERTAVLGATLHATLSPDRGGTAARVPLVALDGDGATARRRDGATIPPIGSGVQRLVVASDSPAAAIERVIG